MLNLAPILFVLFGTTQIHQQSLSIDAIIGKSATEIENVLGKATGHNVTDGKSKCTCPRTLYRNGSVAIFFRNDVPDWLWIDSDIKIENLATARIKAYHRDPEWQRIIIQSFDDCCQPM